PRATRAAPRSRRPRGNSARTRSAMRPCAAAILRPRAGSDSRSAGRWRAVVSRYSWLQHLQNPNGSADAPEAGKNLAHQLRVHVLLRTGAGVGDDHQVVVEIASSVGS